MKTDLCLLLACYHWEYHLYLFCSGDTSNDWLAWTYLDSSVLLCSSPTHAGADAAMWCATSKESMDFSWLMSKHQLHKHRINSKEEQICLSWALQQMMVRSEHDLRFTTWGSPNLMVWCFTGIWFGIHVLGPSPHCPGFSNVTSVTIALKCKNTTHGILAG